MAQSGTIETQHKLTYNDNTILAVQNKRNRFDNAFSTIAKISGEKAQAVDLLGPSEGIMDAPGNTPTPNIQPDHSGIWVQPRRFIWGRTIPKSTPVYTAVDYQSSYVQDCALAYRRAQMKIMGDALLGPRLVAQGTSSTPVSVAFDTANQRIGVDYEVSGTNTNLTVKKFAAAVSKFEANDIDTDDEEIFIAITAKQNESLYGQLQVTSADYRDPRKAPVFEGTRVKEFMGVKIVIWNKLPLLTTYNRCVMWCKSGMHYGDAVPFSSDININPSLQNQPHIFAEAWMAATRSEDEKVVEIVCDPTK